MSISRKTLVAVLLAALPGIAHAQLNQQWGASFVQEPARLNASAANGSADPNEKDFAWGDLDQDGEVDLVSVRKVPFTFPGGKTAVLYMNVDGVLTDETAQYATDSDHPADNPGEMGFLTETNSRDVVIVDLNGDGWLDVATAVTISDGLPKSISHPRIYINQGNDAQGHWKGLKFMSAYSPQLYTLNANGTPNTSHPVAPRFCGLAAGDVDGNGTIDLYFTDYDTGEVGPPEAPGDDLNDRLWLNNGQGVFTDSYQTRMTAQMLQSAFGITASIVDMNGDGKNDIVKDSALGAPQSISVSYRTPVSGTSFSIYDQPYEAAPYFVSVGDLNNDGKLDMVATDDDQDRYLLNSGNDAAGRAQFAANLEFSDADGSGDGGFGSQSLITDLNNDGFKDVLISNVDVDVPECPGSSNRLHIYHNHGNVPNVSMVEEDQQSGSGGWKGAPGLTNNDLTGTYHTAVFDLDGDGDKDLMIGRCNSVNVWMNQLNPCTPVKYGTANSNSTGQPAQVAFYGSGSLAGTCPMETCTAAQVKPHLIFNVTHLPPNATGHLVYSMGSNPTCSNYGDGKLCLQRRTRDLPELDAVTADATGHARIVVDFTEEPFASADPGQHRYFQFVYDDAAGGPQGFNLSPAVDVKVCQ